MCHFIAHLQSKGETPTPQTKATQPTLPLAVQQPATEAPASSFYTHRSHRSYLYFVLPLASVLGLRRPSRWVALRHPPAPPSSSSRATHTGLPHPPSSSGDPPAASSSLSRSRSLLAQPGTRYVQQPLAVFASVVTSCNLHTQAPRRTRRRTQRILRLVEGTVESYRSLGTCRSCR